MQNIFIVNLLLLSHGYSCLSFALRVYTFNSPTFRSPSRRHVLLSVKTSTSLFWIQFPMFIYAPGANGRLHWLLPWKLSSFEISTFCSLFYFFDYTRLEHGYFHSVFQMLLRIWSHLRTKRLHTFLFILNFKLILPLRLMCLNWTLQRFAILSSFLFIFICIFITLQYDFEDFIVPSCCLSNLILRKLLRIMKLRILVLYLNLL